MAGLVRCLPPISTLLTPLQIHRWPIGFLVIVSHRRVGAAMLFECICGLVLNQNGFVSSSYAITSTWMFGLSQSAKVLFLPLLPSLRDVCLLVALASDPYFSW